MKDPEPPTLAEADALTSPIPGEWMVEVLERVKEGSPLFLERQRPDVAARALWMMACGVSKQSIEKQLGIERHTLTRLAWRQKDTLETKRKEFSRELAIAAETYKDLLMEKAERLAANPELLDAISPEKLALAMAITTDKSMALAGMAGVVIEHRRGASIEDAMKAIAEAKETVRAAGQVVEAEIIERE